MRIGLITEGVTDGADQKVCEYLINQLRPEAKIVSRPLGSLKDLRTDCGNTAALLLAEGCERILIVWDLYPSWREDGAPPCRHEDKEAIFGALREAEVELTRVCLVCIEEELEAWLLADGRALSHFFSTPNRAVKIGDKKHPERVDCPKTLLTRLMKEHTGRLYTDRVHARQIVERLPDLKRLRNSVTFRRFEAKVVG